MKIIDIAIEKLKPYENNPRINDKAVEYVANSIKEFGFKVPIIIDENNIIVAGHTRLKAAEKLQLEKVPCIIADDLTDEQIRAFRLADNKAGELAEWDEDKLYKELLELETVDFQMENFGFETEVEEIKINKDEDFDVEKAIEKSGEKEESKVKPGEIWKLGEHYLMCGDSTSKEDIKKLMGEKVAKCLFTSPPYNMGSTMYENYEDNLESRKYIDFNLEVVKSWSNYLNGFLFWNISYNKNSRWEFIEILYKIVKETGLKFMELIVWDKGHGMPIVAKDMLTRQYEDILMVGNEEAISEDMELIYLGTTNKKAYFNKRKGKGISNYWRITTGDTQLDNHKACFPVDLPVKAIRLTTNKDDIVVDCFGGSGTTLIAAEKTNRKCYTMELDPLYCDVIIERWEKFTEKKAEKIG